MTLTGTGSAVILNSATPKIQLHGTEGSAGNISLRENAGKIELYDETGAVVLRTLYPEYMIVLRKHIPILSTTGGAETASTTWKEPVFYAPPGSSFQVIDAGVIPDYGTVFGQVTSYFSLGLVNKGTDGTGTTAVSAVKAFSTAATVLQAMSFGAIVAPNVAAGEVLAVEKTITSSGMICQGCTFYVVLKRIS
jgi:hypothetical protein